ncbi:hypothetical protein QBC34DRAFT_441867 [Podospora aff. communis PSN243]|uniref:PNPLA domain-containing protein n=1 Tax=Podospora aff. communis PSN243 TaxID=3040156 RepID=A0AAV9GAG2_9PEZI|nr:hypothetical protein QBC34DRAFT_441867 [Podospora aff. communis PSN243]
MSESLYDGEPSPPPFFEDPTPESDCCDSCENGTAAAWMCVPCGGLSFCARCWGEQLPHKRTRATQTATGSRKPALLLVPHEKVTRSLYYRMTSIFNGYQQDGYNSAETHAWASGAKWFGIGERSDGYSFVSTNRLADIVDKGTTPECPEQFPSFVSFVGETGAGKSAVVAMLISYQRSLEGRKCDDYLPILGVPDSAEPTTGDVQLYPDPATHTKKVPILYADCEGLNGGDQTPKALENVSLSDIRLRGGRLKDIAWASVLGGGRKREQIATTLFPKLLYSFSDTVVFVTQQARKLESLASEFLIPWADRSAHKSLNQAIKPHLIIVINAVGIELEETGWDVGSATKTHMKNLDKARIDNDENLKPMADRVAAAGGGHIDSVGGLMKHYYSSVTVLRLPQTPYYGRMEMQVCELYNTIHANAAHSYSTRSELGVAVPGDRMERLFSAAFSHFSRTIDEPFDLLAEAWRMIPALEGIASCILQFILTFRRTSSSQQYSAFDSVKLLNALASVISSIVLLDAERKNVLGEARQLFRGRYVKYLSQAFNTFCGLWLPCTYQWKGYRCRNFKSTHTKGHQRDDGKVKIGPFQSDFAPATFFKTWVKDIEEGLVSAQGELALRLRGLDQLSRKAVAALVHRDRLIHILAVWMQDPSDFISHKLCLFCACQGNPEHPLPCGHVLCGACAETFHDGSVQKELLPEYSVRCPLHQTEQAVSMVALKPNNAGLRILCLDGGGIRGIVQLAMLRRIQNELGSSLRVQSFFDLVVGTSTGGITALRLFAQNKDLEDCVRDFKSLCSTAFTPRRLHRVPMVRNLAIARHGSVYRTEPLEKVLRNLFGEEAALFGAAQLQSGCQAKVAVASTESATGKLQPVVLSNYNRSNEDKSTRLPYEFLRNENAEHDLKIWEAARATSAAFPYFKSFLKQETGQDFLDGGFYNNCPAKIALSERQLIWNDVGDAHPDLVLSLGTGHKLVDADLPKTPARKATKRPLAIFARTWTMAGSLLEDQLECDRAWEDVVRQATDLCGKNRELVSRYVRLNVDIPDQVPRLDEVRRVEELEALVHAKAPEETREVAHRLIASCFLAVFKPMPAEKPGRSRRYKLQVHLGCRFSNGSHELKALGRFLKNLSARGSFRPSFQVEPDYDPKNANQHQTMVPILDATLDEMCGGVFAMSADVALGHPKATIRISISLQDNAYASHGDRYLSISGFPRLVNINNIEQESRSLRPREVGGSVYQNDAPPPPYSVGDLELPSR